MCPWMCLGDYTLWDVISPSPKEIGVLSGVDYVLGETPLQTAHLGLHCIQLGTLSCPGSIHLPPDW